MFAEERCLADPFFCLGHACGPLCAVSAGEVGLAAIGEIHILHGVFIARFQFDGSSEVVDAVFDKDGVLFSKLQASGWAEP